MTEALAPTMRRAPTGIAGMANRLVPAICDVSVTNLCNATCNFCSYAHDKGIVKDKRWIDRDKLREAMAILHRRGVRYINYQGGEPLLHPKIDLLVSDARENGLQPAMITNGWLLPEKIERVVKAGLGTLLVSLDSDSVAKHEENRGLKGVCERAKVTLRYLGFDSSMASPELSLHPCSRFPMSPPLVKGLGLPLGSPKESRYLFRVNASFNVSSCS